MSVGISVIEILKSGHFLYKLEELLRRGATDEYERYAKELQWYAALASMLDNLVDSGQLTGNHLLTETQQDIKRLVENFHSEMRIFEPNLGSDRKKRSFRNAVRKIKWMFSRDNLKILLHGLESRLTPMQSIIMQLSSSDFRQAFLAQGNASAPLPPPLGDRFVFEDAFRRTYSISFRDIDTWEQCYEFLLRLYPKDDQHCGMIDTSSYMFYNTCSDKLIVPAGPYIKSFRTLVKAGERIEMSMIFPYEERYSSECAGCSNYWPNKSAGKMMCPTCSLCISIYTPSVVGPDRLTQVSLDSITGVGARAFLEDFIADMETKMDALNDESELMKPIKTSLPASEEQFWTSQPCPKIKHFRRVTFCSPQWPDLSRCETYLKARERSGTKISRLDRNPGMLQINPFLPAHMLGFRLGGKGIGDSYADMKTLGLIFELLSAQNKLQSRHNLQMENLVPMTENYLISAHKSCLQLHPFIIKARCRSWMLLQLLAEPKMSLKYSETLSRLEFVEFFKLRKPSVFRKIVDSLLFPERYINSIFASIFMSAVAAMVGPSTVVEMPQKT